jgi:hypothetical protein
MNKLMQVNIADVATTQIACMENTGKSTNMENAALDKASNVFLWENAGIGL